MNKKEKVDKIMMVVTKEVSELLKDLGNKRETYDDVIRRLIIFYNSHIKDYDIPIK